MDPLLLASEPWSPDCKLFHPLQDQILLYESANCISVQAFLKMCGLPFEIETRANAENMSPSGQVPFIKSGSFVISEMDPIIEFAKTKGYSLSSWLNETQLADMRAYMTLVDQVLLNAEYYICWCHEPTLHEYTYPRYTSPYPWPLNSILFTLKKRAVHKRLGGVDMKNKTYDEVMESVESTLQALSDLLSDWKTRPYFFGDKPTELDALVFGHLSAILTTALIDDRLAVMIKENKSLERLCNRIATEYFHVDIISPKRVHLNEQEFCISMRKFAVGVAIASLLLMLAVILLVACILQRRRRRKDASTTASSIYSGPYSNRAYSRD